MRILRSVNRRGFSVGSAGWFTVLRPNQWFPATRLPEGHRHISSQAMAVEASRGRVDTAVTAPPQITSLSSRDPGLVRPALTVLAAIAIASFLLWWIIESQYH
jgi:hypothetical protein